MNWGELKDHDATALAGLIRRGEVSALEVSEAAIEVIAAQNPILNAVITPLFDEARRTASAPLPDGPFAGVPFLLKDLMAEYAGARLCEGSAYLRDHISTHDSELVARYRRAGLVVLGKTNTPEFGLVPTTEPALFGPTRNPWDTSRTTGGSSGGSSAAVAARWVPMAHANDGGGSIRIPASCCGLFGMKPTRGRNPMGPDYGDVAGGLAVEHVVTRSVRDSAILLDATGTPDTGDPYVAPRPARPFAEEMGRDPGQLRIVFSTRPVTGLDVHPDCVAAVREAADLCAALGHEVSEGAPEIDSDLLVRRFGAAWGGFLGWAIEYWRLKTGVEPSAEHFEPATWKLYQSQSRRTPADYLLAIQDLQMLSRQIAAFSEQYDVWLTPTLCAPPQPLGYFDASSIDQGEYLKRLGQYTHFTLICNVTGQPAVSVPLHWNADKLPIGTQFIGRYGDESTLFRLAAQLEQSRPWAQREPPLPV
jgi:amidase